VPINPDVCEKEGLTESGGGGAALPVDLAVAVRDTSCDKDLRAGENGSVTFDIISVMNPGVFPDITLVVTYPASVTSASLTCTNPIDPGMEQGANNL
jgi:hypothetical protein